MPNLIWDGSCFAFLRGNAIQFKSQSCASRTLLCVHITSSIHPAQPTGAAAPEPPAEPALLCIPDWQQLLQTQPWAPPPPWIPHQNSKIEMKKPPTGLPFPTDHSSISAWENTSSFFPTKFFQPTFEQNETLQTYQSRKLGINMTTD